MNFQPFLVDFRAHFSEERLKKDEPLKSYTTWRVGGPADLFFEAKSIAELVQVVELARKHGIPFFVFGGGSNILVGDKGIRGLVIKNSSNTFEIVGDPQGSEEQKKVYEHIMKDWEEHSTGEAKHTAVHFHYYDDEKNPSHGAQQVFVRIDSGYSMAHFIRDSQRAGLTGIEWFSRIPGNFGGWVYNNVHGHTLFIGDFIHHIRVLAEDGRIDNRSWKDLDFGYDYSIFHTNKEVILDGVIRLFKGDVALAQEIARDVVIKKNLNQPANSAGCVFHNISESDAKRNNFESTSIGYIVDKVLGWNGTHKIGGAWISQKHGNFIETDGTATAADVVELMEVIKKECRDRFGIELKEEIFRVGEF